jgi:hypothetical protein
MNNIFHSTLSKKVTASVHHYQQTLSANHAVSTALSVHSFVHVLPKTTLSHSFTTWLGLYPRLHERLNLVCLGYFVFARYHVARTANLGPVRILYKCLVPIYVLYS